MKKSDMEILNKKFIDPLGIGFMCVGCNGGAEKVTQAYIYDLDSIISRGNHERAQIAAEVLLEQGREPHEVAYDIVFPTVKIVLDKYEKKEINKVEFARAVLAADKALESIGNEAGRQGVSISKGKIAMVGDKAGMSDPETVLAKAVFESLGYGTEEITEVWDLIRKYESPEQEILKFIQTNNIKMFLLSGNEVNENEAAALASIVRGNESGCQMAIWGEALSLSYIDSFGTDFYCREPMLGVRILMCEA